jgi:hypothetical protein
MATEIQVVNMALGLLEEAPIVALSDDNKGARLCNLHYAQVRQAELTRHVWGFSIAKASVTGTDLDTGDGTLNWSYSVPAAALRILPLTHDGEPHGIPINWRRQGDVILSDHETPIIIRYVQDMTDPTDWPPLFVDVVATALAVKISLPLTHKSGMVQMAREAYQVALGEARRVNAFEASGSYYDGAWSSQRGDNRFWRA